MDTFIVALVAIAAFWSGFAACRMAAPKEKKTATYSRVPEFLVKDEAPDIVTTEHERENELRARTHHIR